MGGWVNASLTPDGEWVGGWWVVGGCRVSGWVGGWVGWGGFLWSFLSPLRARLLFEAQLSSLPPHVVPRTVPTRRHQLTEIALPDGCRVLYGRLTARSTSPPRADCCYARRVRRRSSSSRGSNARRPSSTELDDEAAVIICCPREGGGGGVESAARSDDKYSPHSQTRLLTRPAVLWCIAWVASATEMSRAGAHSSTWAIICPREGGGGGVGAAASSRLQILASHSPRWRLTRPTMLWCVDWVASAARVSVLLIGATTTSYP